MHAPSNPQTRLAPMLRASAGLLCLLLGGCTVWRTASPSQPPGPPRVIERDLGGSSAALPEERAVAERRPG